MNALTLIPPKIRLYCYLAFSVAGLAVSSVAVYSTAIGDGVPTWVVGAGAVLGSLAAPFGAVAASNTTKPAAVAPQPPLGAGSD